MQEHADSLSQSDDEQAYIYLLAWLRELITRYPNGKGQDLEPFGFDIYRDILAAKLRLYPIDPTDTKIIRAKQPLLNVIWDLCVRGILRPGANLYGSGGKIATGNEYALTDYGIRWLQQTNLNEAVPNEYSRFSQLLARHDSLFGDAYKLRAQESVRCYEAHTYFACCALSGAAAESILLTLGFQKIGEEETLRGYQRSGGRNRLRNRLIGQAQNEIQTRFDSYLELINYWRDESAHGVTRSIGEAEAFTSLLLLLRFAQLASNEWANLTTNPTP